MRFFCCDFLLLIDVNEWINDECVDCALSNVTMSYKASVYTRNDEITSMINLANEATVSDQYLCRFFSSIKTNRTDFEYEFRSILS
jgi:hypothetical protein